MPGSRPSLRQTRSNFSSCAVSSEASDVGKTAQVYAIDGPSTQE